MSESTSPGGDDLWRALIGIEGVVESPSAFGEKPALWVNGKEIAHEEGSILDIRLTRALIKANGSELRADERVTLRSSSSDWIDVATSEPGAKKLALRLVRMSADAHRAPAGTTPALPPEGHDLERRRRFH
jgi:hypothetical protein